MELKEKNLILGNFLGWDNVTENTFSSNWRNLIKVVEKIESFDVNVTINKNYCNIHNDDVIENVFEKEGSENESKIQVVFETCVEFCVWLADTDLFEFYKMQPPALKAIISAWEDSHGLDSLDYSDCADMLEQCEAIGYTFDYQLDAQPFGLTKIK